MPLPAGLPIVDHHCHLSPRGDAMAAVRRFKAAGGTHLFLATQNYEGGVPVDLDAYLRQFEQTERLARAAREEGVVAWPVVAPYPVDLVRASEKVGLAPALELHRSALELAGRWVRERRAVAVGEVGRPHFPVAPDLLAAAEAAFLDALRVARDSDCPAVVHCDDLDAQGYSALAELGRRAGLRPERLIKHYARDALPEAQRAGITPSILARRALVDASQGATRPCFWETDYLDDPQRPGAVLDLATVPRRARELYERSPEAIRTLEHVFVDSVRAVYGWAPGERP